MMGATTATAALLLLGLAASAVAGPVNTRYSSTSQCAAFCPENSKFGFETGKTYEYDYESTVKTHIPGASSDHSSLQMEAIAKLEVVSRCEMVLRLQSVNLKDFAPGSNQATTVASSNAFASALEHNPLHFAFVSGNIESICPASAEETWVLNIKRALLSHIQNTMNDFNVDFRSRETDVIGDCPVTYTTESADWSGVQTIKKVKDVQACAGRLSADTVLQGIAYRTASRMQSMPLMKGSHECQQNINKQGVLTETTCTESHLFRPFSKGTSGATTDIATKLTFKGQTTGIIAAGECGQAEPITFAHEQTAETLSSSKAEAEAILRDMCTHTTNGVSPNAPALFGKLVTELKKLNSASLVSLHSALMESRFCRHAEQYLHDAIPTIGTEASARLIKNLIMSGDVTGAEATIWLNSLAFVQKPTVNMMAEVAPLLSTSPVNRHAALAVSSLVNNFCKTNKNCANTEAVRTITDTLEAHLTRGCANAVTKHNDVMAALKALGNIGHGDTQVLNACIRNTEIPAEVRVTAINAFRRMECDADRSELVGIFEDSLLDSELRINAYLSLMACPTIDVLNRVRTMLGNEEVNQVGSFVWTHLMNLKETSSPLKQDIRQIVEMESLSKEFNSDKRKFSRNIEKSYFSEMFNSGASVESHIIFSPESFVPRSVSLNLTTDLFGHSVNLVEIGGRVEGLNGILDDLFDSNEPADKRKETTPEINRIDKNFGGKKESEPKGSAFIRVFGNEIAYGDFHDLDAATVREKFNYLNWLIELAKEHNIDFSKSFQFVDTKVNVATITGFPLHMHVLGNGMTDIKLKGKMDLRNLATSPHNLVIDGSIAPSASIEITGHMGVDAHATKTGVRTVDNMHTSTIADASIELRQGRIFAMDVKMARDKMEIFSAKHDLYVVYRGENHPMTMPATRITYSDCLNGAFTKITGFDVCIDVEIPNEHSTATSPYVPLTTPAHVSISLNKRDTFTNYHFEAKALRQMVAHGDHRDMVDAALLTFNTPGSHVNRELTVDFSLNHSEKTVAFNLVTPWMPRAHFSGALTNTDALKRATGIARLGRSTYEALAELQITSNKYNTRYQPKFELKMPGDATPTISGSLLYRIGRKVDVNLVATDIFSETVNVEGSITAISNAKKTRYDTTLNIKSPLLRGKVDGFVDRTVSDGTVYSSRLEVVYMPTGSPNNRLTFSSKIRDKNNDNKIDTSGTISFISNMWPTYDTDAKFNILQQGKTLTSSLEVKLADDERKTLKIEQNGLINWNAYTKKANMKLDVTLPYKNIDYKVNVAHLYKRDLIQSSASLMKDGRQHGLLDIDISRENVKPLKANADIKFEIPGRKMRYHQTVEELGNKQYKNVLSLQLAEGETILLTADYKMLPRHEFDARLTTPYTSPIKFIAYLNPDVRNLQAKASLEHKARLYEAEGTVNMKLNNYKIAVQFVHPSRTITTDAQLKRVGKVFSGLFETKWDTTRDVNKKFTLSGDVTLAKMRPRLSIKAEVYPNINAEFISSGAFMKKGDITNKQGSIIFRSSFENFEDMSVSFKHKKTLTAITSSAQMSWAPNSKIDGDFNVNFRSGWNSVDANAKLLTPFSSLRRMTYQVDYAIEGTTFRANTIGVFNKHKIGFVLSGLTESQRAEGSVIMTSSIPQYEKFVLKGSHIDTGRKCHTDAELTWGSNQKIALVYNMEHARSGYHLTNNGDFQITTPFRGYRKNKITWAHSNDESSIKQHSEVEMFKNTIVYDFDASLNTINNKRHFQLNTFLTGPNINMQLKTEHEHNIANIQGVITSAFVQWQSGKIMKISNTLSLDSTKFQDTFKFISPFESYEAITVTLDNTRTETGMVIKNEAKWPANKASFNGLITSTRYGVEGNLQLETPFMPTQKMTFKNTKEGEKYIMIKTYEYAPGDVLRLIISTEDTNKLKEFKLDFSSPFEPMKTMKLGYERTGTPRDLTLKSYIVHNLLADVIDLNAHIDTADKSDIKATFNLKTPIRSISNIRAVYSHKLQGREFECAGSFQIPSYKATFNHEMTVHNWRYFNSNTAVMFRPGQKIEFSTHFQIAKAFVAAVSFKSPFFNDMEELTFNLKNEGFKTTFVTSIDKVKQFTGAFDFTNNNGIHITGQLTTPFAGYKNNGFTFNYEGELTDLKIDWIVNCENDRIAGQTSFVLNERRLNLHNTLTTPFPGFERATLTYDHEGTLYNFNCEGLVEFPGNKFTLKNNFALTSNSLNAKINIRTPFRSMQIINTEVSHEGPITNFKNSASILLNNNKYEANSNYRLGHNSVSGSIVFHLPEEYSITFRHNGDSTNFNNNIMIKYCGEQITSESAFKYQGNNIEGNFKVKTPFEGFETVAFIGNHQGPINNFRCDYTIEFGTNKITISDEFKISQYELAARLDINTPFNTFRNFNAKLNHEGPINNFKNSALIKVNNMRYIFASEITNHANAINGKVIINIPEEYSLTISHQGSLTDFSNSIIVKVDTMVIEGNSELKTDDGIDMSVTLNTPFRALNNIVFKYRHSGIPTNFNQQITLTHGGSEYLMKLQGQKTDAEAQLSYNLKTPFEAVRNLEIEANHNGRNFKNFRNNIDIIHNGIKRSAGTDFKWYSNLFKLKATAKLPEDYTLVLKNKVGDKSLDMDMKATSPTVNINGGCNFKMTDKEITGSFDMATPFTYFRSQTIKFEHKMAGNNFNSKMNIKTSMPMMRSMEAVLSHDGSLERFTTNGALNIDSQRMSFAINHEGRLSDFKSRVSLTRGETISAQAEFHKVGDKITSSASLHTPINGYETMTMSLNHDGYLMDFTTIGSVALNNQAINGDVAFKQQGTKITTAASLTTPFENFEKMTFAVDHVGRMNDFASSTSAFLNDEGIRGEVAFKQQGTKITTAVSLNTPFENFEKMAFTADHVGLLNDFESSASALLNNQGIRGEVAFQQQGTKMTTAASLTTPYENFEKMTFTVDHVGHLNDFASSASALLNDEGIRGEVAFKQQGPKTAAAASLTTPFENFEKITFNVDHVEHLNDFASSASAFLNDEGIRGEVAFKQQGTKITTSASVTTPFENFKKVEFTVDHVGRVTDFTTRTVATYNDQEIAGELKFQKGGNAITTSGSLTTPVTSFKKITFSFNHAGYMNDFTSSASFAINSESVTGELTFKNSRNIIISSGTLTTPVIGFEKMDFTVKNEGEMPNQKTRATMTLNDATITTEMSFQKIGNTLKTTGMLVTPFTNFRKASFAVSHKGSLTDFTSESSISINDHSIGGKLAFANSANLLTTSGSISTPVEGLEKIGYSFNHAQRANGFTSTISFILNEDIKTAELQFQNTGSEITVTITTPITGFEKLTGKVTYVGTMTDFTTGTSFALNDAAVTGQLKFKMVGNEIATSVIITTPFTGFEKMDFAVQGQLTATALSTSIIMNGHKFDITITFENTGNAIRTSVTMSTPFDSFKIISFKQQHEGVLSDFTSTSSVTLNEATISGQLRFKLSGDKIMSALTIATPFMGYEQMTLGFEGRLTALATTASVTVNGNTITVQHQFSIVGNKFSSSGSLTTPFAGMERFGYKFAFEAGTNYFSTSGTIKSPYINRDLAIAMSITGEITDFVYTGSIESNGVKYAGNLGLKLADGTVETSFGFETPERKYDNVNIVLKQNKRAGSTKTVLDIKTPFTNYKSLHTELNLKGHLKNFHTSGSLSGPIDPIGFELNHEGDLYAFATDGAVMFNNERYASKVSGQNIHKFIDGNVDVSGSIDLPRLGEYGYNLKHMNTREGFTTEGSIQTPHEGFERASFEVAHEGGINKFATSGNIKPFSGEGSFNVNHEKTRSAFRSSANAAWNNRRINGNAEYKNEDGLMEASAVLTTPFEGYEKFEADAKHSQQGRKIKTEAHIKTPFREIRQPSFTFEHLGHWKNFKSSVAVETPFKTIKPVTFDLTHHGIPRDFTTTGNVRYGRNLMTANAKYQRTANGFTALADLKPFSTEGKYGFNVDHSYDGSRLNTKGFFETPHHAYKNFGIEVNHEGTLRKFDTIGSLETPFTTPITFEMHHNGVPTNYQSRASLERDGQKVTGEVRYSKRGSAYEGLVKVATPHHYLQMAELALTHNQGHEDISGDVKASYNAHKFDGGYSFSNGAVKSAAITIRQPKAMEYTATMDPTAGTANILINWNANRDDKYMRFEGMLKNINNNHQMAFAVKCPHHTRRISTAFQMAENKLGGMYEILSDTTKFRQEIDLTRNTRGREIIYDGSFKTVSPFVNFEVNGNHKVNPGRRYMSEINIVTGETITIRSDIKTPGGLSDFSSTFVVVHPRFSRNIVLGIDGKIVLEQLLLDGKIDLEYAAEKFTVTGKIADESNRYRTKWITQSSLKHPRNNVDITYKGTILNNKKMFNMDSKFSYLMSATKKMNTMTGIIKFDKIANEFKLSMDTPVKTFDLTASQTINEVSRQHYTVASSIDGNPMNFDLDMDQTIPSISSSLKYAPEKTLHMFAKYASEDHFQMEAYRQVAGRKYPDGAIEAQIEDGHILKARVFLRPGTVSDISEIFSVDTHVGRFFATVSESISNDISLKLPGIKHAIEPLVKAAEFVSQAIGVVAQRAETFFNNNQFYTRDIANAITVFYRQVRSFMDEATTVAIEAVRSMNLYYIKVAEKFEECRQWAVVQYNAWYQEVATMMTETRTKFNQEVARHISNIQGSLYDLANAIRTHPRVQAFLDSVQLKVERIMERIIVLADKIVQAINTLLSHPRLNFIREYATRANEKTKWLFEFVDMEAHAREWLQQLKDTGLTPIRNVIWKQARNILHLDETRINRWSPEHGEIAGQIYIPLSMESLRSLPTINFGGFVESFTSHIPDTDWVLWDTLYAYKPSSDIRDWIPPFKSHATFAGNQHYMTFDKKFFEFAGECSYLLARDFIDGSFSVIVNYQKRNNIASKKSMTIIHGKDKVEILPDFRIEMNGRRSELPIISDHTAVYRVGNTLRIDNDHGVKITCNLPNDHCTVSVTGWYFGKTAGLLGTYDNEPTTDFTTLSGTRATTTEEFARSWAVGKSCRNINHAVQEEVSPAHPKYDACAAMFQSQTSAFRPCFKQVDPIPFMKMCINGDMCKVSSMYVTECKLMESPIRMPRQCVTCQLPSGTQMSEGQEETIRDAEVPKSADVIFVVSHGECNERAIPKMSTLAGQILSNMKEQGVTSVNFGIVGYGGRDIENIPHSHTMDGHLLNTKTTFLNTMSTFHTMDNNNENEDALQAVEFASRYTFRAGASKSIVLLPCYKCTTKRVSYATLQNALTGQDIKFHMLIQEDFKLISNSKSPKTSFMYGVDRNSVFTAKDARGGTSIGDKELRRHTQIPKDLCVALTHESNGSVFNLRKLTETKPALQKRFATVLGRVIAKKGAPPSCQHCVCRSDEAGSPVTDCNPCKPASPYVFTWDLNALPEPDFPIEKSRAL